jgi:adenylate cyclase
MALGAIPQDRYRVVESIGRGGMGEVWLADDLVLHRQVALKFPTSPAGGDALDQLLSEARAAAALDHPFICSIIEVSTLNDRPCIVMEYVRGETLQRRLRRSPLALAEGLSVAEEIAEALDAAHKRRVIHQDLKPANVMLTEDQHIKVMDFGLAARLPFGEDDTGAPGEPAGADEVVMVRGTPAYMAPEQIRGGVPDRRSDIFSFGIVLYELLSGTNPFVRRGIDATMAAILTEPVVDLHHRIPAIPGAVSAAVARMLAREAAARYQSFAEIRKELRRLAMGLAASVPPAAQMVLDQPPPDEGATLIGRAAEHAQLLQSISHVISGRGMLVALTGEAGIGKTRLAEEALDAARRRGCQTLVGRCYEQDGTPPLIPYIEVLEDASRLMPAPAFRQAIRPGAPELATLLPELHRLFPDMAAPLELPPHLQQRYLFANVRDFLTRAGRITPLIVFIDDFQWADESTVQLTQYLAQHLAALPVLIIAAHREAETTQAAAGTFQRLVAKVRGQTREGTTVQAVKATLTQLVSQGHARAIALRPFSEPEVGGMLASLGRGDPPATVVRKFFNQTGGNPFFVTELFRHLKEEGRLFDARQIWKRSLELNDVDVPESVRVVLERRLQRVSGDTLRVLTAAAVIGRHFEVDLLEAVAEVDSETLISALDEAERVRLVHGPSGRREVTWRFGHQLICQTLVQAMPVLRRQKLHLRVADAMERLDGSSHVHASEIGHHLYNAGRLADPERTSRTLMTAGDAAYGMYATEEAVQHYRCVLEVLREVGGSETTGRAVEERLADLLAVLGDGTGAMGYYDTLATVHEAGGASIDRARIARKSGTLHWRGGDRTRAMACYQRALKALDGSAAHIESAHLYQELGLAAFRSGDNQEAIGWAQKALQSAELAVGDAAPGGDDLKKMATAAIAHATNTIGVALARSGELDAAREHIERSVAVARQEGLLDVACRAYANLGVLYSTVEPKRAIEVSLTGLELASKIGATSMQSYIYANLAAAYCALTDRCETEGLEAARVAADLDRQLGQLDHLAVPLIVMAQIHQCRGELPEAQRHYDEALALAERAEEPQLILPCYDGLATICLDRGDRVRAQEYMEKARQLCGRTGLDADALLMLPFLS